MQTKKTTRPILHNHSLADKRSESCFSEPISGGVLQKQSNNAAATFFYPKSAHYKAFLAQAQLQ